MRKIKYTINLLFSITILNSCNFFGPVDSKSMKPVFIKPKNIELIGKWEIDSFSYNYIKKDYNIDNKKVTLEIQESGTFFIKNLPDYEFNSLGKPRDKKLYNIMGNWELEKVYKKNYWKLNINFKKDEFFKSRLTTSFNLYRKNGELVILKFIGDPDSGNRLLFRK